MAEMLEILPFGASSDNLFIYLFLYLFIQSLFIYFCRWQRRWPRCLKFCRLAPPRLLIDLCIFHLLLCLWIYLYIYSSVYLLIYLFTHDLFISAGVKGDGWNDWNSAFSASSIIYLFIHLFIYLFIYFLIYALVIHPFLQVSKAMDEMLWVLRFGAFIYLYIHLFIYLFIYSLMIDLFLQVTKAMDEMLEILPFGASKWSGVAKALDMLGCVSHTHVYIHKYIHAYIYTCIYLPHVCRTNGLVLRRPSTCWGVSHTHIYIYSYKHAYICTNI